MPSLGNRTTNDRPVAGPRTAARAYASRTRMPDVDPSTATFSMSSDLPSAHILPQRPTGRMFVAQGAPMWPIVVIVLALLATVIAIGAIVAS